MSKHDDYYDPYQDLYDDFVSEGKQPEKPKEPQKPELQWEEVNLEELPSEWFAEPGEKITQPEARAPVHEKTETLLIVLHLAAIVNWLMIFAVFMVVWAAKPEQGDMFATIFGLQVRVYWLQEELAAAYMLAVINLAVAAAGLTVNVLRYRIRGVLLRHGIVAFVVSLVVFVAMFFLPAVNGGTT